MLRSISPGRASVAEYDGGVLWAALLLLTFGAVMVYSSSIAIAEASRFTGGSSTYFLQRHVLFVAAGGIAGMLAFQVPVRVWQQAAPWLFLVGVTLLALLLREPDFGAFVVVASIATGILFLGGMNGTWFAGLLVMMAVGFVGLVLSSPYRMQRIFGFMDPWSDPFGRGYQLSHALIAFGRGEWFGVGLGASVEKLLYLPEAHTDFLLAVIGEELGFAGVLAVIALFSWLVLRAFAIGRQAVTLERPYAALVAQGIGVWLGVQVFINMGVNMGVLPTKGLTLPLMSFGGSGLLANCVALAILLRIDWENRQIMRGVRA